VYIVKNSVDNLYIGISKNPQQRLADHNSSRGSEFTKHGQNYQIVFLEEYSTLAAARKREIQIKKWRREKKEVLITKYEQKLPTNHL
jgi:putative endonuclease